VASSVSVLLNSEERPVRVWSSTDSPDARSAWHQTCEIFALTQTSDAGNRISLRQQGGCDTCQGGCFLGRSA
jgi:hypothetical protein